MNPSFDIATVIGWLQPVGSTKVCRRSPIVECSKNDPSETKKISYVDAAIILVRIHRDYLFAPFYSTLTGLSGSQIQG